MKTDRAGLRRLRAALAAGIVIVFAGLLDDGSPGRKDGPAQPRSPMDTPTMTAGLIFDLLLAGLILWLGWGALASNSLFRGIVLYVAFGLSMGLAWARLDAPDVALAEIAVGAGLTGALFLVAAGLIGRDGKDDED